MVHRFRAPSNGRANSSGSLAWYSFDSGPIHVVQMSSEHDWLKGSEQHTWLDQDLARANANRVKHQRAAQKKADNSLGRPGMSAH